MNLGHVDSDSDSVTLNLTPLIDMVFILLIFFMVTSSFVKETGVKIKRPGAETAVHQEQTDILIAVTRKGLVWVDRKEINIRSLRSHLERLHAENPEGGVIIAADRQAPTGVVIRILDQARLAGIEQISIAAEKVQAP